ncbi:MAG: hypothetical protein IKV39_03185 [Clostridia bacterium]|nr:hypothetical protein [Clostridia bacterium]
MSGDIPLEELDYNGETFMIHTSINVFFDDTTAFRSSNYLIQGEEEVTGDKASDSALQRNIQVENDLNVRFAYIESDFSYNVVGSEIRAVVKSGADGIYLIINDSTVNRLSAEGLFHDASYGKYFDFSRNYWYDEFMESSSFNSNTRFMLAGDYFIDVIRHSNCMLMNKDYYRQLGGDPELIYDLVESGGWTMDALMSIILGGRESYNYLTGERGYSYRSTYIDTQGNQRGDSRDKWGIAMWQTWGPMIPFITSCDPGFISRDEDGYPVITVNNERTVALAEKLDALYHSDVTAVGMHGSIAGTMNSFTQGRILFLTCQVLGNLESPLYANTDVNMAILPYPKLDDLQPDYITTANDAEVGFIPSTISFENLDFVSAVVEYLSRITAETVMEKYYESTLKVRYARESNNGKMIQLIHDSAGNIFPYIWDLGDSNIFTGGIYNTVHDHTERFASHYRMFENSAQGDLEDYIDKFEDVRYSIEQQYGS